MWRDPLGRLLILASGLIAILLCGVLVFGLLLFGPFDFARDSGPGTPSAALTLTAPPAAQPLIVSGEMSVPPNVPVSLTVGNQVFALAAVNVGADGSLVIPPEAASDTGYWLYGTLINYVIGLPNNSDSAVLIGSLRIGDTVQVALSRGGVLQFRVTGKLRVAPTASDLFAQTRPGLTLFLVGGVMTDRLVVTGDFAEPDGAGDAAAAPAGLNEIRSIGDLDLSVQLVRSVSQPPEVPPGWSYLLIEYTLTNNGAETMPTLSASASLSDARGEEYSPVFQALNYATYPALPAALQPGESVQASTGYLVPGALAGPNLLWRFYPNATSSAHLDFSVPYSTVSARIVVELTSALLSEDGHDLIINGVIYNPSAVSATITRTDVRFTTENAEDITLRFFDPSFSWEIGPRSDPMPFTLTYVRPQGRKATLKIFDFVFDINLQSSP